MSRPFKLWFLVVCIPVLSLAMIACSGAPAAAPTTKPVEGAKPAAAAPATAAAPAASKVDYPTKTVTFMAPSRPGSGFDTTARAIAAVLEKEKLVSVALPVMNSSSVPEGMSTIVQQHKNDPNMIAVQSVAILMNQATGSSPYGYKDSTPIATLISAYYGFLVREDSPYKTLMDLFKDLKDKPNETPLCGGRTDDRISYGAALAAYGVDIKTINYAAFDSGTEAATSVLEGSCKAEMTTVDDVMGLIEGKKLRVLAVSGENRLGGVLQEVPTYKEAGLNLEWTNFRYIAGGPGMPDYAVQYWRDVFTKMVTTPAWKDAVAQYKWGENFKKDGLGPYLEEKNATIFKVAEDLGMKAQ
jgi:putative tricarboxylic transport membrane protein